METPILFIFAISETLRILHLTNAKVQFHIYPCLMQLFYIIIEPSKVKTALIKKVAFIILQN